MAEWLSLDVLCERAASALEWVECGEGLARASAVGIWVDSVSRSLEGATIRLLQSGLDSLDEDTFEMHSLSDSSSTLEIVT